MLGGRKLSVEKTGELCVWEHTDHLDLKLDRGCCALQLCGSVTDSSSLSVNSKERKLKSQVQVERSLFLWLSACLKAVVLHLNVVKTTNILLHILPSTLSHRIRPKGWRAVVAINALHLSSNVRNSCMDQRPSREKSLSWTQLTQVQPFFFYFIWYPKHQQE